MSNGDDETEAETDIEAEESGESASLADRLDSASAALDGEDAAEAIESALEALEGAPDLAATEPDLDDVEATLDEIEAALEDAELPEPEDEEEDDPREALESRLDDLRSAVEEARGPYASDVVDSIESTSEAITNTRWTESGEDEVVKAVAVFLESADEPLEETFDVPEGIDSSSETLEAVAGAVEDADLDPDDDAETISELLEAAETLSEGVDDAEEWDDLSVREQLDAQGFYEVLEHHKDYPPEWSALKVWEKRGNAEMVLLALEKLESDFMEEHCLEALRRMGPEEAIDPMLQRANRRDKPAIEILGKIGSAEPLDTLLEYAGEDADDELRRVTLKALGEIGSAEATQTAANALVAENPSVRSRAARTLGLIGDPRAVEPLGDTLERDDENEVRASAAWALVQIGTETALENVAEYTDDRSYLVQNEAEKAADALGAVDA